MYRHRGLRWARELASIGLRIFPICGVDAHGNGICLRDKCEHSIGKHPLFNNWKVTATTSIRMINNWWARYPTANVGVATGHGLFVVDIDPRHGGFDSFEDLECKHERLPDTLRVETGGGGVHYYLKTNQDVMNGINVLGPGIDIRGKGGFVVGPGSRHVSGRCYELYDVFTPMVISESPHWLVQQIKNNGKRNHRKPKSKQCLPRTVREGGRNSFLFGEALYHKIRSFSHDRTLLYVELLNERICQPPLETDEVETIVDSVYTGRRRG